MVCQLFKSGAESQLRKENKLLVYFGVVRLALETSIGMDWIKSYLYFKPKTSCDSGYYAVCWDNVCSVQWSGIICEVSIGWSVQWF